MGGGGGLRAARGGIDGRLGHEHPAPTPHHLTPPRAKRKRQERESILTLSEVLLRFDLGFYQDSILDFAKIPRSLWEN